MPKYEARRGALKSHQTIERGGDPRPGKTPTFGEAAKKMLEHPAKGGNRGSKGPREGESILNIQCIPLSGTRILTRSPLETSWPVWNPYGSRNG